MKTLLIAVILAVMVGCATEPLEPGETVCVMIYNTMHCKTGQ